MAKKVNKLATAIEEMVKSEELDKILEFASVFQKKKVKKDIKLIMSCLDEDGKMIPGSTIPLLHDLSSVDVMRDIICFMQII